MSKILSMENFRRKEEKGEEPILAGEVAKKKSRGRPPIEDEEWRKGAGSDAGLRFRTRFVEALRTIEREAAKQVSEAKSRADVKIRINVSQVLKLAKASPLSVYSPQHREALLPLVEDAKKRHQAKLKKLGTKLGERIGALSKWQDLERGRSQGELSRLASEKLSVYFNKTL